MEFLKARELASSHWNGAEGDGKTDNITYVAASATADFAATATATELLPSARCTTAPRCTPTHDTHLRSQRGVPTT
eukprot:CAMPEP_0171669696 /NCGR_PEP_ID=MMETSP0990-20121206/50198_1 /TAXON_ID=483369 /ORGANISM="non described non described, Strain CCMP2098" /LENGTH=75 /DNA_ID=CAMNT_0012254145 /DNA_START=48 /DNA_END=272 /DNA_ORIENTATION=+